MATHDEEDVRSRNTRRTQQPRNRDFRTVKPTVNEASIPTALGVLGAVTRGASTGSRAGVPGAIIGGAAALGTYYAPRYIPIVKMYGDMALGEIEKGISSMSRSMSPSEPVPNYNIENGRYIAQPDAITVTLRPSPAADYLYSSRKNKRKKSKNQNTSTDSEPEPLPVDVNGQTEAEIPVFSAEEGTGSSVVNPVPPEEDPNRRNDDSNGNKPKGRLRRAWDALRNKDIQQTPNNTPSTPNNQQNGSFVKRLIWETKNNNFGPSWRWRNTGRIGLVGAGTTYKARQEFWPGVIETWKGPKEDTTRVDTLERVVLPNGNAVYIKPGDQNISIDEPASADSSSILDQYERIYGDL